MTKNDLKDYAISHGCNIQLPDQYKANIIRVNNPKNKKTSYLRLPFDNSPLEDFTIYKFCIELGIPIPEKQQGLKGLNDFIDNKYKRRK